MTNGGKTAVRWYEVVYVAVLLILCVYILFFSSPPRVGVLDLGRLARLVGMDARITDDARETQRRAAAEINRLEQAATAQAQPIAKKLKTANDADKEQLNAQFGEIQKKFQEDVNAVRAKAQRHRDLVILSFRHRVQSFVDQVAQKRRLDLVMDPTANVLYISKTRHVDITEDVAEKCRSLFSATPPLIDEKLLSQAATERPAPAKTPSPLEPGAE